MTQEGIQGAFRAEAAAYGWSTVQRLLGVTEILFHLNRLSGAIEPGWEKVLPQERREKMQFAVVYKLV